MFRFTRIPRLLPAPRSTTARARGSRSKPDPHFLVLIHLSDPSPERRRIRTPLSPLPSHASHFSHSFGFLRALSHHAFSRRRRGVPFDPRSALARRRPSVLRLVARPDPGRAVLGMGTPALR